MVPFYIYWYHFFYSLCLHCIDGKQEQKNSQEVRGGRFIEERHGRAAPQEAEGVPESERDPLTAIQPENRNGTKRRKPRGRKIP